MRRYVRFEIDEKSQYGILNEEVITALEGDLFGEYKETANSYSLGEVRLLAPCEPSKAICVGLNYNRHAAELGMKIPEEPIIFLKPTTSICNPGEDIVYWPMVGQMDYEAELAVVIGKKAHQVAEADAMDYVFGYSIGNDVTARDLQRKDGQWTRSKSFNTFLPFGPSIVTGLNPSDIRVQSFLNGEMKQDGNTSDLIFPVPLLVSYLSKIMTLLPGDIILTGTPEGVGPMNIGDHIEIRIDLIGSLENKVVAP